MKTEQEIEMSKYNVMCSVSNDFRGDQAVSTLRLFSSVGNANERVANANNTPEATAGEYPLKSSVEDLSWGKGLSGFTQKHDLSWDGLDVMLAALPTDDKNSKLCLSIDFAPCW
jgi:hypothetical protein